MRDTRDQEGHLCISIPIIGIGFLVSLLLLLSFISLVPFLSSR
jgi:hypothetical protein